jgi:2-hydroxychromene-2-carboxylate isomerase
VPRLSDGRADATREGSGVHGEDPAALGVHARFGQPVGRITGERGSERASRPLEGLEGAELSRHRIRLSLRSSDGAASRTSLTSEGRYVRGPGSRGVPRSPVRGTTGPSTRPAYARGVLILHHDITAPRSALAVLRLQRIADLGHPVAFLGLDVLGLTVSLPVTLDQLADMEQVSDRAAELGLVMRRPVLRPPTLDAHLVGDVAERAGLGAAWRSACLTAYWTDGQDVSDHGVLLACADRVGLDAEAVHRALADKAMRDQSRAAMLARRALGVGGAPVLEVGGTLLSADVDDATLIELAHV